MKILKFDSNDKSLNLNIVDTLYIKHIAFAGINIFEENKYANICFECLDRDNFLINLHVAMDISDNPYFADLYGDLPLVGLMHTGEGVAQLAIFDLFRKSISEGKEYYSVICWDTISGAKKSAGLIDKSLYYKLVLTRNQFYYLQSYVQNILIEETVDYFSNDLFLLLTPKSNNISIDDPKDLNFKIIGVNYPKKSGLLFRKDIYQLDVLMLVNEKYCVYWHLSYNKEQINEILKHKKFKEISIDDVYDMQIYQSIKYIVVDYAKSANNPIQKVIILSNNIGTAIDEFDINVTLSIHKQLYINWVEKIYEELIK